MRQTLEALVGKYSIYSARRPEFDTGTNVPFRVSPHPFCLPNKQKNEIRIIGSDVSDFIHTADELYRTDTKVHNILSGGKPEIFLIDQPSHYPFIRPDLIITPNGFTLCEVETSLFGLALAEILNKGYRQEGFNTMVGDNDLQEKIDQSIPTNGTIVYSANTKAFAGQLSFLADNIFSSSTRSWRAQDLNVDSTGKDGNIYRGFYLAEYLTDPYVKVLLDEHKSNGTVYPSLTPHMEEKALLALLWDKRWEILFRKRLGDAAFNHLRMIVPPTWIVGEEKYFALGLPDNIEHSVDLATLSSSKRAFVLKTSGFGPRTSWSEGVTFLHKKSRSKTTELLEQAETDRTQLYIVQEFRKALDICMTYEGEDGKEQAMKSRIRITPYYSFNSQSNGKLIGIKATGCEDTDHIHATSTSINTAVS